MRLAATRPELDVDPCLTFAEFQELVDQFPFGNASLHSELLEAKHGDTCEWVMKDPSFEEWRGANNGVYSILAPGMCFLHFHRYRGDNLTLKMSTVFYIAGSGKTTAWYASWEGPSA